MKLSADLVMLSPQFTNTLKDREIDFRGNKVGTIENLGATLDQFDTIDLSDNDIRKLDGFPLLKRLKTLFLNNNRIIRIAEGLEHNIPFLEELILTNNQLTELGDIDPLASLPNLTILSLLRNPITKIRHYRHYCIFKFPKLRLLDFQKVKESEREEALELFGGQKGDSLQQEVVKVSQASAPVEKAPTMADAEVLRQTAAIKAAIQNATSLEEVQRLEQQLKAGIVPGAAMRVD